VVKYRNKFEETAGVLLKDLCKYESEKIPYVIHKNYIPDFVGRNNKNRINILVEAKGYFRVGDTQKYKSIRDSLPKKTQLVFLLYNPNKKLRKGSRMTMAKWCEKENIKWYTLEDIRNAFTS
tara:strand:+ start:4836 stop:5201 length:366 start_codon:yes stop_codon:yes gene_type:complete